MKLWVTLDMLDGSKSKQRGPFHSDELSLHGVLMYLHTVGVAGVTLTRADLLTPLQRKEDDGIQT